MTLQVGDKVQVTIGVAEVLKFHPPGCPCCSPVPGGRWELAVMLADGRAEPFDVPVCPDVDVALAPVRPVPGQVYTAADATKLLAVARSDSRVSLVSDANLDFTPEQAVETFGPLTLVLDAPGAPTPDPWADKARTNPYVTDEVATPIADATAAGLGTGQVEVPVSRPPSPAPMAESTQVLPLLPEGKPPVHYGRGSARYQGGAQ